MEQKTVFTHEAREPRLPDCHGKQQRRFLYDHEGAPGAAVVRFEDSDRAQVSLSTHFNKHSNACIDVDMTAKELKVFAMALLDAAHDLETVEAVEA